MIFHTPKEQKERIETLTEVLVMINKILEVKT